MSIKLLKRLSCGIISGVCCCLFCLLLAKAANADVCFLPEGKCMGAGADLSSGCNGFDLAQAKDETGWSCTKCGDKWKCEKKSCKDDYQTGVRCTGTETKVCDETRKSGDESCCKCEDSETKCQHEGYAYKKTKVNICKNKCPYNGDMYEICECPADYDKETNTDKCSDFATCEVGDLADSKKFKVIEDLHNCRKYENNEQYVTQDSEIYKGGKYDCVLVCSVECTKTLYYSCSPKKDCKASEGKYETEELCRASLQHASVFDIFKKYIPNFDYTPSFNLISTSYAATLDHEVCWYCETDPNPSSCYAACNPQTALDPKPLCPIDQDRNCVSCTNDCDRQGHKCCSTVPGGNPSRGCIGMMMNVDETCVKCKTDDPTWRAEGCEDYPCCPEESTNLCRVNEADKCVLCANDCTKGDAFKDYPCCSNDPEPINTCLMDLDKNCAICDGECIHKIACCDDNTPDPVENSPCELKDGCWVAKQNDTCANGPYSWRDSECCALDKWKNSAICKKPTCTITAGGKSFTTPLHPYDVSSFYPTGEQCGDQNFVASLGLYNRSGNPECMANDPIVAMIRYCGSMSDFASIDDMNVLANAMYRTSDGAAITNNSYHGWLGKNAPNYTNLTIKDASLVNTLKSAAGRDDYFWINTQDNYSARDTGGVYLYYKNGGTYRYYVLADGTVNTNSYNLGMCVCRDVEKPCNATNYPYVKASGGGATAFGGVKWDDNTIIKYLNSLGSIYAAHTDHLEGDFDTEIFNRIADDANECTDENGVKRYDKICAGTPEGKCAVSTTRKFTPSGCTSSTYIAQYDGKRYYKPSGATWGECKTDCSGLGSEYYATYAECLEKTGKVQCFSENSCWRSCESAGYYSTEADCSGGKADTCVKQGNCYVRNTFYIRYKSGQTRSKSHSCPYYGGASGTASWWAFLGEGNNIAIPKDVNGVQNGDVTNSKREFKAGTYYLCVGVSDTCSGGRNWGIRQIQIVGYLPDANGEPTYGYTPGGSYCFADTISGNSYATGCDQTEKYEPNHSCHSYELKPGFIYEVSATADW